jgi:transposase
VDNLNSHHAKQVLLFTLTHPHWEFVYLPTRTPYLNLIEPWWKVLRSLALKGRRFETWQDVCNAVRAATDYWNQHRHPFRWGRKRKRAKRSCTLPRLPGTRLCV